MALANPGAPPPDEKFDIIVIGSGYGAGVCAARLAQAGAKVCVLERGREFTGWDNGGPFPTDSDSVKANVQLDSSWFRRTHRLGLFDFHVNEDLDVLVGCGLGGTSLINANVSIRPDARVFQRSMWPDAIRKDPAVLDPYFERARAVLGPMQFPVSEETPKKLAAMEANGGTRCEVNVHFTKDQPSVVPQKVCTHCGDCVTGCNVGAKKTVCFTYLAIAKSHGASIFVQCDVDRIEKVDGGWTVHYQRLEDGHEPVNADRTVTAPMVVVGAGVLGTTGILLRSKEAGVPISDELGGRLSGNGDALAFAYNCDRALNSVGYGANRGDKPPTGASILGVVDRRLDDLDRGVIIEEGAFPSAIGRMLRLLVQAIAGYTGSETQHGFMHWFRERIDEEKDLFGDPATGALDRTLVFLLMGHDGADGLIELDDRKRAVVKWPELHERKLFTRENDLAKQLATHLGGMFVTDPLDTPLLLNNLITVHPLGGCPMGDDGNSAVVDDGGQVFDDDGSKLEGLYVSDASVIPTSLGVNPLWTISALAERIADRIIGDLCARRVLEPKQLNRSMWAALGPVVVSP